MSLPAALLRNRRESAREPCESKIFPRGIREAERALSGRVVDIHRDFISPTTSSGKPRAGTPVVDVKADPALISGSWFGRPGRVVSRGGPSLHVRAAGLHSASRM